MKKSASFGLALLVCIAIMSIPISSVYAGGKAGCKPSACAKTCTITNMKACTGQTSETAKVDETDTDGKLTGAKGKMCSEADCRDITLSIAGMTCTGCEGLITKALMANKNVLMVRSIDYKTGMATVCCTKDKIGDTDLIDIVASAGYKAVISAAISKLDKNESETEKVGDKKTDY